MKKILIEIDERSARDLDVVAPAKKRVRAEFIRRALRHALDVALDRKTEAAYRALPMTEGSGAADVVGWDPKNELARPAKPLPKQPRASKKRVA